jgi:hypothetical protein
MSQRAGASQLADVQQTLSVHSPEAHISGLLGLQATPGAALVGVGVGVMVTVGSGVFVGGLAQVPSKPATRQDWPEGHVALMQHTRSASLLHT